MQPSAIVTQLLSGRVPAVTIPEASPWAAPLADVVMRALSADPEKRFSSAAAMTAEVRRIGALKLPLTPRVAAAVRGAFGDAMAARRRGARERRAPGERRVPPRREGPIEELSVDVTDDVAESLRPEASQTASTVPPPGISAEPDIEIEGLRPVTVALGPPVAPIAVAPPQAPIAIAPPLAPIAVAPPLAPIAVAPPLAPIAIPPPTAPAPRALPAAPTPPAPPRPLST